MHMHMHHVHARMYRLSPKRVAAPGATQDTLNFFVARDRERDTREAES